MPICGAAAHLRLRPKSNHPPLPRPSRRRRRATETSSVGPVSDGLLTATQRLIVEERKAAEALLREVLAREERLTSEAEAAQAAHEYAAAKEKVQAVALLEQEAREMVRAALELHEASASERKVAEELVARGSAQAETARQMVAELEQRLRDAQQSAAEIAAALHGHKARAAEFAAIESAAHSEELEAAELASNCEATRTAAEEEAEAARERAQALQVACSDAGEAESLSEHIAQETTAIRSSLIFPSSRALPGATEVSDEGALAERARRAYPTHPNRQSAFLAGWKACVEQTTRRGDSGDFGGIHDAR